MERAATVVGPSDRCPQRVDQGAIVLLRDVLLEEVTAAGENHVRWPDLSAALVRAGSEDELVDILDEVATPEGCTWNAYRGPLFVEFSLPVRFEVKDRGERGGPARPDDVDVKDVSGLGEGGSIEVSLAASDTCGGMCF